MLLGKRVSELLGSSELAAVTGKVPFVPISVQSPNPSIFRRTDTAVVESLFHDSCHLPSRQHKETGTAE